MDTFSINELVTLMTAIKYYQADLERQIEDLTDEDDNYCITADEMMYAKAMLEKLEKMHARLYKEQYGHDHYWQTDKE